MEEPGIESEIDLFCDEELAEELKTGAVTHPDDLYLMFQRLQVGRGDITEVSFMRTLDRNKSQLLEDARVMAHFGCYESDEYHEMVEEFERCMMRSDEEGDEDVSVDDYW